MKNITKIAAILLLVAGLIALVFAVQTLTADTGSLESNTTYGGDAYTGIQNAAAQTARNVKKLTELCTKAFGGILLALSFAFFGFGVRFFALDAKAPAAGENTPSAAPAPAPASQAPAAPQDVQI